jgi:hypothetical protein
MPLAIIKNVQPNLKYHLPILGLTLHQYARVQLEEATIICSKYTYCVHHFDKDDLDSVLLVKDSELVDTKGPVMAEDGDAHSDQDMSNNGRDTKDHDNADA